MVSSLFLLSCESPVSAKENLDKTDINYCEIFTSYLRLRLRSRSCKVEAFKQRSKPSTLVIEVMMILDKKIQKPSKFISGDSTPKIDIKYLFFSMQYSKFALETNKEIKSIKCIKFFPRVFFHFGVEKTSNTKRRNSTFNINQWKCFPTFLKLLVSEILTKMKLLENTFFYFVNSFSLH